MLCWHGFYLRQLMGWLTGPLDNPLPRGRGVWEIVFAGLHRRVRIRLGRQQALRNTGTLCARVPGVTGWRNRISDRHRHIDWINERAATHFALSADTDRGQALTNLIRHPDFVAYLDSGHFADPLVYRDGRVEGLTLLLQVIPYGNDQNLLVSRDISQARTYGNHAS